MHYYFTAFQKIGILALLFSAVGCKEADLRLLHVVSREFSELEADRVNLLLELDLLGTSAIGQTTSEFGAQHLMMTAQPPESPWVQIDLGKRQPFDSVTLVPAILPFDGSGLGAYAFPRRFRVDASDVSDFAEFQPLCETDDADFNAVGGLPLVIETPNAKGRFLRVTVNGMSKVAERWTFALAEIIVLQGNKNLALNSTVNMRGTNQLRPNWHTEYLVDGRTPLGPPVLRVASRSSLPEYDGVFNGIRADEDPNWMEVDLGEPQRIDEIRLHPVHARQGANVPGYAFPLGFRVEASLDGDFTSPAVIYDTRDKDFSNPGNNLVTFRANGLTGQSVEARYVRVVCLNASTTHSGKFGFSELQVYAGQENVARGKPVSMPNVLDGRPPELLVDGDVSYGKIVELPEWIDAWKTRRALTLQLSDTELRMREAMAWAKRRLQWVWATLISLSLIGGIGVMTQRSRRQRREQSAFREQLARDLHDEIGSNLAAIARVSEVAELEPTGAQAEGDWRGVRELALECTESMRDTLWLLGAQRQSAEPVFVRLEKIARRMLGGVELVWSIPEEPTIDIDDDQARRELTLAFKEILANIARHAKATKVAFDLMVTDDKVHIELRDNGVGFEPSTSDLQKNSGGVGLRSITQRIVKIGGNVHYQSASEGGTLLVVKLPRRRFQVV